MLTQEGFLFFMRYQKPPTSIEQQITIMRNRGLIIEDESYARQCLQFVGYFRLSGYALPFQLNYNNDGSHTFIRNTCFEDISDLYVFDRKLRLLVIDALERIEVAVRATISQVMSERVGVHWYLDCSTFSSNFDYFSFFDRLKKDIGHDHSKRAVRQVFIQHYFEKYTDPPLPPSWMIFEILSLGTLSKIFKNLLREHQKKITKEYELDGSIFSSWLHSLSYLRNLAAHHQRLWNRKYTIKPAVAKKFSDDLTSQDRFYAQAVLIQVLLKVILPDSGWSHSLCKLLNEHPTVDIEKMGFPVNWTAKDLWK